MECHEGISSPSQQTVSLFACPAHEAQAALQAGAESSSEVDGFERGVVLLHLLDQILRSAVRDGVVKYNEAAESPIAAEHDGQSLEIVVTHAALLQSERLQLSVRRQRPRQWNDVASKRVPG